MILIFDLDDTLYPELTYVESGFRAVATYLKRRYGWDAAGSHAELVEALEQHGRGRLFDLLLAARGVHSKKAIAACLQVYRQHRPRLSLYPAAEQLLRKLPQRPYIVTDGHKLVQMRKVEALRLEPRCTRVLITHQHGRHCAKPSTYCFELIRTREKVDWADLVYVGDNPAKDFVNLTPLGVRTVRVLTGQHRQVIAKKGYEAAFVIDDLTALPSVVPELSGRRQRAVKLRDA